MIDRTELLGVATELSLSPDVVEKDYVLGWLLAGIYAHPELAGTLVFKGGTCLKKCYFETYRFSEDLDFTLTVPTSLNESFLRKAFGEVAEWIYDAVGIEIAVDAMRFDIYQNRRGKESCQGRIYYNGPLRRTATSLPRVKLDLTADELIVLTPVDRPVGHPYSDTPSEGIFARCYPYVELMGEKIRALGERTRPRDLYDVISLYRNDQYRPEADELLEVLRKKCEYKNIAIPTVGALSSGLDELRHDWDAMLGHQLPSLPPFDSFWSALPVVLTWLMTGAIGLHPTALPVAPGERLFNPALGSFRTAGVARASHLEIIRFAASNRLCVDLRYGGEVRRIEPYSLRRTTDGNILLYAIRSHDGELRSYRTDRIQGAQATNQTFVPRFSIELTPSGGGAISPVVRTSTPRAPYRSSTRRTPGTTYIYQCPYCSKKFRRNKPSSRLNQHKTGYGSSCSGRTGYLIDTIY